MGDKFDMPDLDPLPAHPPKLAHAKLLEKYVMTQCWVHVKMIKTGFNTRKTTAKGVRRMRASLLEHGYDRSHAIVLYPGDQRDAGGDDDESSLFHLTAAEYKSGKRFLCPDGMHRVRCVSELVDEGVAGQDGQSCGDMVYALMLRPDTPQSALVEISLSKNIPFQPHVID